MAMKISSREDSASVGKRIRELLDADQLTEAISFAESCEGPRSVTDQVRASVYTHIGALRGDRAQLESAAELWRRAGADTQNQIGYNLANTELDLWELTQRELGFVPAFQDHRAHLRDARTLFRRAGDDEAVPLATRIQALTNLGNSYDRMGRDIEAIEAYDSVLALDPAFGMALGNKAIALLDVAPLAGSHHRTVAAEGAEALDAALADEKRIIEFGLPQALEHFRARRAKIKTRPGFVPPHRKKPEWADPYLRWCAEQSLFLHVSLTCLSEASEDVDPLFFGGVTADIDDAGQQRANDLFDAFNSLKQDFTAARYLLWLADGPESPIREHAAESAARASYLDTLRYARWGPRTGMAIQAFASATNLLDKVACAVHMYYRTDRKSRTVAFRYLWHPKHGKNAPDVMDAELVDAAERRALRALCDLSCELETDTPLNRLVERRHAATHRFLAVHRLPRLGEEPAGDWLDHVDWDDLVTGTVTILGTARSALIYLARMIDIEEKGAARKRKEDAAESGVPTLTPPLPLLRSIPEHREFE